MIEVIAFILRLQNPVTDSTHLPKYTLNDMAYPFEDPPALCQCLTIKISPDSTKFIGELTPCDCDK